VYEIADRQLAPVDDSFFEEIITHDASAGKEEKTAGTTACKCRKFWYIMMFNIDQNWLLQILAAPRTRRSSMNDLSAQSVAQSKATDTNVKWIGCLGRYAEFTSKSGYEFSNASTMVRYLTWCGSPKSVRVTFPNGSESQCKGMTY
jgi:hypothetical protein